MNHTIALKLLKDELEILRIHPYSSLAKSWVEWMTGNCALLRL
jgi:hypothetical protein